ncbi:MAG: outer membrane protein assembly factor BamD [Candidatus Omnitrophota bacterium]
MRIKIIFAILLAVLIFSLPVYAGEDAVLYSMAVHSAKHGRMDFAFIRYHSILRDFSASPYREQASFAIAEYYFTIPDYRAAKEQFDSFLTNYPDSKGKFFALAYLYKIALVGEDAALAEDLAKQIINIRQTSSLFGKSKVYSYRTPLYRRLKAVSKAEGLEFYSGGELFAKILYPE